MLTLKDLRERALLSQSELAALVGVHRQTVQVWESGRFKPIPKYQRKLAEALHCTPDELLTAIKTTQQERREQPENKRPAA